MPPLHRLTELSHLRLLAWITWQLLNLPGRALRCGIRKNTISLHGSVWLGTHARIWF